MEFERQVSEGTPAALERAMALYRGDLLEGLGLQEVPFEDWLLAERERLHGRAVDALAKLFHHQSSMGATEPALQTALRLLAVDPLQESFHRAVMRFHAQLGRRASALRQYQMCVGILQRQLGIEPEAATRQLYQEIPRQRPAVVKVGVETPKVHAAHTDVWQARDESLPRELPLIGREEEIHELREALNQVWEGGPDRDRDRRGGRRQDSAAGRDRRRGGDTRRPRSRRTLLRSGADFTVRAVG